ncbi:nitronate monooxygenase [Marinilactibacillus psychrotolerans]|uniref:Probable nitronate monooxygenase n=2 Tax=Marinilactibacillus psychrotolerans TaxID=191770 RepID=A0A5R9C8H6_9LACT|nr:nitronate monooxygenase [Marinilactibacillus psychrotolerans]TLQ09610.1 enoyl-[acyl-carrier-protein] reductase FabK [Marinilactibacillus psychrotolerans]GEQ32879.1 enoyl-ACP reductase 2 [Marinilactibacillus psychrotolerans]SJN46219.1 Enoyl-[acyl-carrier-protein] reductase [FMN] [Marinilactibacillus psychrotolerans 42ea]
MSICKLLGIDYPIFQGAMARIATADLAAAVSNAGGLGIIASGGMTADQLREEIRKCKAMTDKPFAVNLMLMMENCGELVDVLIEEGVKVVTTGAGTPKRFMPAFKENNVKVIPVVPSVKLAMKMEELGADAVVAEGTEAGGHVGETTTMCLVPQVVSAVNIPVIGAGGVGDGRSVAAMYALGAQGVQVGTLFLSAEECPVPLSFKQAVLEANDTATVVTGRRNGAPVRSIKNKMLTKFIELEERNAPREEIEAIALGSLSKAVYEGDVENGSVMAGQITGMVKEIRPAKQIIESLFSSAEELVSNLKVSY